MNNADLIVATLKQAGIDFGFGIPSGNVLPFMEAMRTGGIQFVLTAHEGSAAFAADVMGRMTARPGLCIATGGPGATNLTTGVGSAYLDRSPLIAITCNVNTDQFGRRVQMYIDHHALFAPITKVSIGLRPGRIAEQIQMALQIALSDPIGPVHLDLPEDVALAPTSETVPNILDPKETPPAAATKMEKAVSMLAAALRPVAVIGLSTGRLKNPEILLRFVEGWQIPFATTTMAKGMIDEAHPLSLGCIERGRRQIQRSFLRRSDLVVGLGYDTVEVGYEAWIGAVPLLHVDIEDADVDETVQLRHQVIGDLESTLENLAAASNTRNQWTADELVAHRREFQQALRPVLDTFTPHQAIDVVREVLPHDGILAFDVGAHTHQIASQWTVHVHHTFLITNGWSSMGFGLPAAIAAKLARPEAHVVCVLGDGCFQMTCGELATAKRLGLQLPIVVLDDRWLGLIKVKQRQRQYPDYGTELQTEDYDVPPSHYFGVPAFGVRTSDELRIALVKAFDAPGPTVIEAIVDSDHYQDTVFD
jgi:acetolactate synthase-1/2/3 large subunit